jgi:phosphate transport system substrate-binding protein
LRSIRRRRTIAAAIGALLLASGCGHSSESIVVTGSSTVEPISIAVSERFASRTDAAQIVVDGPGTGDGFEIFCEGFADVNDASSKIKPEQEAKCAEHGVEFIEIKIGNDGIAVMTNTANDEVGCLSFADLYALTGPESQGVDSWSDAGTLAAELGSTNELPRSRLRLVGPGEESGTFVSYVELVVENFSEDRGQEATTRPDYQVSSDDNVIITGIQGSESALGWVGYAFAREAEDVALVPIAEEPGGPCVLPTDETIADGSYPIARPLFIYVNKDHAETNAPLREWVELYLSDEGRELVASVGYVPLSDEELSRSREVWASRTTGPQPAEPASSVAAPAAPSSERNTQ